MKRQVMLEIDCGKKRCKACAYEDRDQEWCDAFAATLASDEKLRSLRCDACLDAEREARRLGEEPVGWPSKNPTWGPIEFTWTEKGKP